MDDPGNGQGPRLHRDTDEGPAWLGLNGDAPSRRRRRAHRHQLACAVTRAARTPRRRGRPLGALNKPKPVAPTPETLAKLQPSAIASLTQEELQSQMPTAGTCWHSRPVETKGDNSSRKEVESVESAQNGGNSMGSRQLLEAERDSAKA